MNIMNGTNRFLLRFILAAIFLVAVNSYATPQQVTYQAKIYKPDGDPLESSGVNFKFSILDPSGGCILFSETYSTVNMVNSTGLVYFSLGSGIKTYPVSATMFADVFSNIKPSLSCDVGGPVDYVPVANDTRKIVMQFNDGSGWQTLPAMTINAVPYAIYAGDAQTLGGASATSYVKYSTIPSCGASEALQYNGASFSCLTMPSSGGAMTGAEIITALGYTPANGASVTTIASNISSVSSTVFAVSASVTSLQNAAAASFAAITSSQWSSVASGISYINGNVGVGTSSPVAALHIGDGLIQIDRSLNTNGAPGVDFQRSRGTAVSRTQTLSGDLVMGLYTRGYTGSGWGSNMTAIRSIATENQTASGTGGRITFETSANGTTARLERMTVFHNGNIGIGTATPITKLDISGGVRISMESATCAVSYAGTLRYNAGTVEFCNGSAWSAFGVSGAGLQSFNGSTSGTQSFAVGTGGTAPAFATADGIHTLNIPYASVGTTTAGLISNADYILFSNKLSATSAAVNTALGYTAARDASMTALTTTVSTLTASTAVSFAAITSSQWSTSGTTINYMNGHVGIGTSSPDSLLNLSNNTSGQQMPGASFPGTVLHLTGADSAKARLLIDSFGTNINSALTGRSARGTASSPSATQLNDVMLGVTASGYGSTQYMGGPSIQFKTTENWSDAANGSAIVFNVIANGATGGGEKFRIDNNGNVGVGTNAPTAKLHLAAGTSTTTAFKFTSGTLLASPASGAVEYDGFNLYYTDGTNTRRTLASSDASGNIANTSVISNAGNISLVPTGSVIVSSTAASTGSQTGSLIVKGGLGLAGDLYSSGTIVTSSNIQGVSVTATSGMISPYIYGSTASGGSLILESTTHANKGNILLATTGGNVGVGTNSPDMTQGKVLHLYNNLNDGTVNSNAVVISQSVSRNAYFMAISSGTGNSNSGIIFRHDSALNISDGGEIIYNHTNKAMQFKTSGTEVVRITSGGAVGIGTNAPTRKLQIGTGTASLKFDSFYSGSSFSNVINGSDFGSYIEAADSGQLVVALRDNDNNDGFRIISGGNNYMTDSVYDTPVFTAQANGYVGIGTSSPVAALHVATDASGLTMTDAYGNRVGVVARRANGSATAPTAVVAGEIVASYATRAHNGTSFPVNSNAAISYVATENQGPTNGGAAVILATTANGNAAGASERMRIDHNGNVGVGTATPTAKLHLAAGTSTATAFKFTSGTLLASPASGAVEYDGFNLYYTDGTNTRRTIASADSLGNVSNTSTISNTGNITLNPTSAVIVSSTVASTDSQTGSLVVKGGLGLAGDLYSSGTIVTSSNIQGVSVTATSGMISPYIFGSTVSGGSLTLDSTTHSNKGNILIAANGGNVGIGTNAPTKKLQVRGSISPDSLIYDTATGGNNYLGLGDPTGGVRLMHYDRTSGNLNFSKGSTGFDGTMTQLMTINSSGNVGIGTNSPTYKLQVEDADLNSGLRIQNSTSTASRYPTLAISNFENGFNGHPVIQFYNAQGTSAAPAAISGTQNIGAIVAQGYNGSGYSQGARIEMVASTAWTSGSTPTHIVLSTTASGSTSYTERMRIDPSGNVGIGTISPVAKLDIVGNVRINSSTQYDGFVVKNGTNNVAVIQGTSATNDNGLLALSSSGTNTVLLMASGTSYINGGNVGIGTSSPTYRFTATRSFIGVTSETAAFIGGTDTATANTGIYVLQKDNVGTSTNTTFLLNVVHNNNTKMVVTGVGNVGVGTSAPKISTGTGTAFTVAGSNNRGIVEIAETRIGQPAGLVGGQLVFASDENAGIGTNDSKIIGGIYSVFAASGTDKGGRLAFYTKGNASAISEKMRIDESGNVGVGTTTPSYLLHVSSASDTQTVVQSSGPSNFAQFTAVTSGINTVLFAQGNAGLGGVGTNSNHSFIVRTNNVERLRVDSSGNVGIGTSATTYTFDVSGTLRVTGQAYTNTGNGSFSILSDIRYKKVHGSYNRGLAEILKINVIKFNYKKDNPFGSDPTREYVGISAQNLQQEIPEAVEARDDKGREYLTINSSPVLWTIINAVKQLYSLVVDQGRLIASISESKADKKELEKIKSENKALKTYLCSKDPSAPFCK